MTAKTMAEVLAEHTPVDSSTDGVPEDEIWCNSIECGFKMERSNDYDETQEFAAHQSAALSAAGFGLVADAKAEALEEAAKDLDWVKPEAACEDAEACCGSAASCDVMRPSSYVVGPDWLRKRAADLRAAS